MMIIVKGISFFRWLEATSPIQVRGVDSGPPLFDEVDDPVKHIDRQNLREMKQAFVLAALARHGCEGNVDFPIALRSAGLDASASNWPGGPAWKAKAGGNARDVFQPNVAAGPKAQMLWKTFCESFEKQEFFKTAGAGIALLGNMELVLPAGELVFVQPFHGRLGNPIDCLVYVKHIELDDCPFILALHSYLPQDSDDHSLEDEFYKLSSHLDVVISELASEFFYYAPMRRQRTFGTRNFGARCREMSWDVVICGDQQWWSCHRAPELKDSLVGRAAWNTRVQKILEDGSNCNLPRKYMELANWIWLWIATATARSVADDLPFWPMPTLCFQSSAALAIRGSQFAHITYHNYHMKCFCGAQCQVIGFHWWLHSGLGSMLRHLYRVQRLRVPSSLPRCTSAVRLALIKPTSWGFQGMLQVQQCSTF